MTKASPTGSSTVWVGSDTADLAEDALGALFMQRHVGVLKAELAEAAGLLPHSLNTLGTLLLTV